MIKKFPHIKQPDSMECGATCLRMIASYYGKLYSAEYMRRMCLVSRNGVTMHSLNEAAQKIGFQTICGKMNLDDLVTDRPLPCILHWRQNHFVVLHNIKYRRGLGHVFYIADPGKCLLRLDKTQFLKAWTSTPEAKNEKGILMVLRPTSEFYAQKEAVGTQYSFRFLWGYVKQYTHLFVQLLLGIILGSLLQLTFPFLTQAIVDKGIVHQNLNVIYLILLGQLMLVIGRTFVDFIRRWLLLHISTRINISLLSDFFIKLMKLPMSFFDAKIRGDLLQRIQDHKRLEQFITTQTLMLIFSTFTFFIYGGVLLYYNYIIFIIFFAGSLLYTLWVCLFLQKRKAIDYEFFDLYARNQNKTLQILEGIQDIKLQNSERRECWDWEDTQADLFHATVISTKLQQTQEAGTLLINEIKNIIITIVSATLVINNQLTLGMMLSIQYIAGQLNTPIEQLARFINIWQDVQISLERINEIHQKEDENAQRNINTINEEDIFLKNVSFQYNGSPTIVLNNVTLQIPYGKTTAIVGASGSGKTTLMKLLLGFYKPVSGEIYIGSNNIENINLESWRRLCGVVMQEGYIFSTSIAHNIGFSSEDLDYQRMIDAAHIANVSNMAEQLPSKYDTLIGANGQGLSQGQKQRILIARAIYKKPHYMFFDEATNALDANNENHIMENVLNFMRNKTLIIVAHRLSTVKRADQIIVINNGEIAEIGSHNELIKQKGYYYQLIKDQLEY